MATAGDAPSSLSAALRADLFSAAAPAALGAVSLYQEEFSEEDVWGGAGAEDAATEAEDVREPPQGSGSAGLFSEAPSTSSTVSTGGVVSRAGWDTRPSPLGGLTKGRGGLSALAAGGFARTGQGPGPGPGAAGDILGPLPPLPVPLPGTSSGPSTTTASVFIPRFSGRRDSHHSLHSPRLPRRASAPVNVPNWSQITGVLASQAREDLSFEEDDDSDGEGDIMVPPHELVAREYANSVSFSVREGVGRTLKGRDLDHVRTAVLRKTGFLDS